MLKTIRTMWGKNVDSIPDLQNVLQSIQKANYQGIEVAIPFIRSQIFNELPTICKSFNLDIVAQIHAGEYPNDFNNNIKHHLKHYNSQLDEALKLNPILINCHLGVDIWPIETQLKLIEEVLSINQKLQINNVVFETHRQRIFNDPIKAKLLISKFPQIKLNCDVSHWVLSLERQPTDQIWWKDIEDILINNSYQIHARTGTSQQIQVSPQVKENEEVVNWYLQLWKKIMIERKKKGDLLIVTSEYGPYPYQIVDFCKKQELSDIDLDNLRIQEEIQKIWKEII